MKAIISNIVLALAICSLSGCDVSVTVGPSSASKGIPGSGVSKTEVREVESFESVALRGYGTLKISQGEEASVAITTDDNILEFIESKVEDGVLVIAPKESISPKSGLTVELVAKDLEVISADGAASIELDDINAESLKLKLAGAGKVGGTGSVSDLTITLDGAGTANLGDFIATNLRVTLSGAGSATVHAKESVKAVINGVGSITVQGNPENVDKEVNGIGRIKIVE